MKYNIQTTSQTKVVKSFHGTLQLKFPLLNKASVYGLQRIIIPVRHVLRLHCYLCIQQKGCNDKVNHSECISY